MRWYKKPKPINGQERVRKGFLFLPKTINGETRWLEKAMWTEYVDFDFGGRDGATVFVWKPRFWVNK